MPKLSTLTAAQSDTALKNEGVWHDIAIPGADEPLRLKMRSTSSAKVRAWDMARVKTQRAYYANDGIPPVAVLDQNEIDRLAEVLVLDWNLTDDTGPVSCTPKTVREVMAALPDTRREALAAADRLDRYRREQVEAIEGNSSRPSLPTSGTGAVAA